jgi:hypothetical protein
MENAEETTSLKVRISMVDSVAAAAGGTLRVSIPASVFVETEDVGATSSPRLAYVIIRAPISVL